MERLEDRSGFGIAEDNALTVGALGFISPKRTALN